MPSSKPPANDPLFNTSLEKGLRVLSSFRGERKAMTLREVAEAAEMTKSSAQRLIYTLEKLGLVRRSAKSAKYQLAIKVMELGVNYLAGNFLVEAGSPFLSELTNATGETTSLTEPDGVDMVYVSRVASSKSIPLHLAIGSRIPMYCTGSGRAYLSALPEEQVRALLAGSVMKQYTQWTECDPERIVELVRAARSEGYAYNKEEYFLCDMTIAAPILGASGTPIGAVHVVASTTRWTLEAMRARLAPHVIEAARGIGNAVRAAT